MSNRDSSRDSKPDNRPNLELDRALEKAVTPAEIREITLATLARQGTIVRSHADEYNNRLVRQRKAPEVSLPVSGYAFEKEIRFHPESEKQTLVIRANSQAELDELEAQILHY